jgi:hypothetical protein
MTQTPSIPSISTATDPIGSPEDMRQRWRALLGPLGFGERLLWCGFVGADRRMVKAISQVPIGTAPHRGLIESLMIGLTDLLMTEFEPGTSVALLLTRPGSDPVSAEDRRWAKALTRAAARIGVPIEPIFRANDEAIVAL